MKIKQAVITAAGFGSRFLPIVKSIPKEMLPIVDKPIIQILVEECFAAGIEEVIIVVRKGNNLIRDYFEREVPEIKALLQSQGKMDRYAEVDKVLNMKGIKIIEQFEELSYGNGSPIVSAKEHLNPEGHFAVLFGDDLVLSEGKGALAQLVDLFETLAPNAKKEVVGIRHGEKIHEILLTEQETYHTKELEKYYVILPEFLGKKNCIKYDKMGKNISIKFSYTSDNNTSWLSKNELLNAI